MNKKLITARRTVERLRLEAAGADKTAVAIWEAGHKVADLEEAEREGAVRTARSVGRVMDAVLLVVAVLTMAFSLQNIHDFASGHGVQDPIAWFLAPAVDLALLAALMGDAVLSRWQLDAGPWATRLRWYAGAATLSLNAWEAVVSLDPAAIVLHVVPPTLLFVLAEAASPYRVKFAETVKLAGQVDTVMVDAPAPARAQVATGAVYDQEADPGVSTKTPQEVAPAPLRSVDLSDVVDAPAVRLDAKAARAAIEGAWAAGLTIREAAVRATRAPSYVGTVYAQLTKARGNQPPRGQLAIEAA